jgi:hypothetical protein
MMPILWKKYLHFDEVKLKVVISQPMFFPWIGLFEQMNMSDLYIHLDDVQMPGGQSFTHRVQLKGPNNFFWWNAPLKKRKLIDEIKNIELNINERWINSSQKTLEQIFAGLPFKIDAINIFSYVVKKNFTHLSDFNMCAIETIARYLDIDSSFKRAERNIVYVDKTEKLIALLKNENAYQYISGHGGKKYINQNIFKKNDIVLTYIEYKKTPYRQNFGEFNPYVSILHPIAALGKKTKELL